jgi:hypothetical protein
VLPRALKFNGDVEQAGDAANPGQPTRAFMSRPPIFRTCPFLIIAGAS